MPNSQLRYSVVLYVALLVKNYAKLYTQESVSSLTRRGSGRYPSVVFPSLQLSQTKVLDFHMKQLSYAIEQSFLDHADCNFSFSQNKYVCSSNLA